MTIVPRGSDQWSWRTVASSLAYSFTIHLCHWPTCRRWSCRGPWRPRSAFPMLPHCFPPYQCCSSTAQSATQRCWRRASRRLASQPRRASCQRERADSIRWAQTSTRCGTGLQQIAPLSFCLVKWPLRRGRSCESGLGRLGTSAAPVQWSLSPLAHLHCFLLRVI